MGVVVLDRSIVIEEVSCGAENQGQRSDCGWSPSYSLSNCFVFYCTIVIS